MPRAEPYSLRHRLRWVLLFLGALTVASGVGAVSTALVCHLGRVESERFEDAARRAARIGQLAREQYIHEAHTVLVGDRSHVDHHDVWVDRLHAEIAHIRPMLTDNERHQADLVEEHSRDVARIFARDIVPAVMRGDHDSVRVAHDRADNLVHAMTDTADDLGATLTARAKAAEVRAERDSWIVTALVLVAGVLASVLGLNAAGRLWRDVVGPLEALESVTRRVGEGDRTARMGSPAVLELRPLASAFDAMLHALTHNENALRAADRLAAIGRVAAGVAHELNNPLGVIRGYVKTLRRDALDARLANDLKTVDDEAVACQRIVEDLLAYAHVPALEPRTVGAVELAEQALLRCVAESGGADVTLDVEPAQLEVDPVRLRQVLINVIRNAVQASDGVPVEVRGHARGDGGYVYRVLDRGHGLSTDARERLFEPFFTTRPDGTGLGLAVSYGLVVAHGGTLRAEPREGGGTEIIVELPAPVSSWAGQA